jgi:hypothetical protein
VVARQRREDAIDRDAALAWRIAKLQRAAKVPDLQALLTRQTPKVQTAIEQKQMIYAVAQTYGLQVRPVNTKRRVIRGE